MTETCAAVPLRWVGPVRLASGPCPGDWRVPLATYEQPLWPSVARGARVSRAAGGLHVAVGSARMSRSILLAAPSAARALELAGQWELDPPAALAEIVGAGRRYARFLALRTQVAGHLLYARLEVDPADAAGHNMVTAAADAVAQWLLATYPELTYVSVSGNTCCDKKPAAINGILGRGRVVIVEGLVPAAVCQAELRVAPGAVVELNTRKNLLGTQLAGGLRAANAHFANMLLAFYLATGQDGANVVEGSQGFTTAELRGDDLYFAVTVPHVIVGTVGSGKDLPHVRAALERLDCLAPRPPGENAARLAALCGAAIWCGELSLLAALTHPGELMRAHRQLERRA
ncbi:MAG: hydroxymethylglutaryl-CoA reductase [Candidatus Marinimicrobia bacterium]|nr:hydroxymethylglutaryl-CoA reductase [Candidatus Neomarinimicrobiota bacterium]